MDKIVEELLKKIPTDAQIRKMCSDSISKWAKSVRSSYDAKQDQFANRVGVSRATVGQWEAGIRVPTVSQYMRLSDWFGVPVSQLVGMSDNIIDYENSEYDYRQKLKNSLSLDLGVFNEKGRYFIENFYYMMLQNPEYLENPDAFPNDNEFVDMFDD